MKDFHSLDDYLMGWLDNPAEFPDDVALLDLGLLLAAAVKSCHEQGVILADLKPRNVLMNSTLAPPEIALIDFGSSVLESDPRPGLDYTPGYGASRATFRRAGHPGDRCVLARGRPVCPVPSGRTQFGPCTSGLW